MQHRIWAEWADTKKLNVVEGLKIVERFTASKYRVPLAEMQEGFFCLARGYFIYFCIIYLPLLSALLSNFYILKKKEQAMPNA